MQPTSFLSLLATDASNDPRVDFWRNTDHWPRDVGGYVFMARALLQIGRRAVPGEWSDDAPATRYDRELPENLWLETPHDLLMRGVTLLRANDTSYRARVGTGPGLFGNMTECQYPTTLEWKEAVEINKRQRSESSPKVLPFFMASFEVETACLDGALKSATMAPGGGALVEQPWHFWNFRSAWTRFDLCRAHPAEPERIPRPGDGAHYLFVTQVSLDQVLDNYSKDVRKAQSASADVAKATIAKRAAGRPPEFDWSAFARELWRRYAAGELAGLSKRAITDGMLQWCVDNWDAEPNSSHARERISNYLQAFEAVEGCG